MFKTIEQKILKICFIYVLLYFYENFKTIRFKSLLIVYKNSDKTRVFVVKCFLIFVYIFHKRYQKLIFNKFFDQKY